MLHAWHCASKKLGNFLGLKLETSSHQNMVPDTVLSIQRAVFSFAGEAEDELSIAEGEVVCCLDASCDSGWLMARKVACEAQAQVGLVPASYLKEVEPIENRQIELKYSAIGLDELSVEKGETVLVLVKEEAGFCWVRSGKTKTIGKLPLSVVYAVPKKLEYLSADQIMRLRDAFGATLCTETEKTAFIIAVTSGGSEVLLVTEATKAIYHRLLGCECSIERGSGRCVTLRSNSGEYRFEMEKEKDLLRLEQLISEANGSNSVEWNDAVERSPSQRLCSVEWADDESIDQSLHVRSSGVSPAYSMDASPVSSAGSSKDEVENSLVAWSSDEGERGVSPADVTSQKQQQENPPKILTTVTDELADRFKLMNSQRVKKIPAFEPPKPQETPPLQPIFKKSEDAPKLQRLPPTAPKAPELISKATRSLPEVGLLPSQKEKAFILPKLKTTAQGDRLLRNDPSSSKPATAERITNEFSRGAASSSTNSRKIPPLPPIVKPSNADQAPKKTSESQDLREVDRRLPKISAGSADALVQERPKPFVPERLLEKSKILPQPVHKKLVLEKPSLPAIHSSALKVPPRPENRPVQPEVRPLPKIEGRPLQKPSQSEPSLRSWNDRTGTFRTDAVFVRYANGKVDLRKCNGNTVSVPLESLSLDDIEHLKRHVPDLESYYPTSFNSFDWLRFLRDCGVCGSDQMLTDYASKFVRERMDASSVSGIDHKILYQMGIPHGDAIKIKRGCDTYIQPHAAVVSAKKILSPPAVPSRPPYKRGQYQ